MSDRQPCRIDLVSGRAGCWLKESSRIFGAECGASTGEYEVVDVPGVRTPIERWGAGSRIRNGTTAGSRGVRCVGCHVWVPAAGRGRRVAATVVGSAADDIAVGFRLRNSDMDF